MDKENVFEWFLSCPRLNVIKAIKQHWVKSKYSYIKTPRPDFGIMILLSGNIVFVTKEGNVTAHPGNIIFLSKNSYYEAIFENEALDYLVCFDCNEVDFLPTKPTLLSEHASLSTVKEMQNLVEKNIYGTNGNLSNNGLFYLLLDKIIKDSRETEDTHNYVLRCACELLQKNKAYTIEKVARECAISSNSLRLLFKERLGISPTQYRTNMRLRQAMYLIESTNKTVSEIATELEFFDAAYFCRVFKEHTGMTPKEYAQNKKL